MNEKQIERLVGHVPVGVEPRHRRRLDGYAANALRCERRIAGLRDDLERALRAVDETAASGAADEQLADASDRALGLLAELDALERIQPRIDAWLRVSAGALADEPVMPVMGEGPI